MTTQKDKKEITRRFRIVSGQIDGITKMIEADKDCLQIINQMKAVKSGFNRLAESFIKEYLKECATKSNKNKEEEFEKALSLLSNY